jgi:hypothetical protein
MADANEPDIVAPENAPTFLTYSDYFKRFRVKDFQRDDADKMDRSFNVPAPPRPRE